jgi:hypothetical protein
MPRHLPFAHTPFLPPPLSADFLVADSILSPQKTGVFMFTSPEEGSAQAEARLGQNRHLRAIPLEKPRHPAAP